MIAKQSRLFLRYLIYRLKAADRHEVHSPFVFAFIERVLRDKNFYPEFERIEQLRKKLLEDERLITVSDYGAGSILRSGAQRKIRDIAGRAANPPKYGQLLFRIAKYFKSKNILEIGTSLGLSTAYLASADREAQVVSLEGCPETAGIARKDMEELTLGNVQIIEGEFDTVLPGALERFFVLDLVFIDGNHRRDPVLKYFNRCLQRINDHSVIILDDIHWTREMELAWEEIKGLPQVVLTLDLFFMGLVFFNKGIREKQHFILKF